MPLEIDDGQAIMEEMVGDNSLDDPNYILQGLTYISSVRPDEQLVYNKAKDAQIIVQSQVGYLTACALEGIVAALWQAENDQASKPPNAVMAAMSGQPIIGVLGCGQVGCAVLRSLLEVGWEASSLAVCARDETAAVTHFRSLGVATTPLLSVLASRVRVLVIAVGPAHFETLATSLAQSLPRDVLVLSAVAAVPLAKLRAALHAQHVVRTRLEPGVLKFKWDVHFQHLEEADADEPAAAPASAADDEPALPKIANPFAAKRFTVSGALAHVREAKTPETAKGPLEAAATHFVQETDDILHTFAAIERYYIYGLGLTARAARRSARRAVLGVESTEETLPDSAPKERDAFSRRQSTLHQKMGGNAAITDVFASSVAKTYLKHKHEQKVAAEEERRKAAEEKGEELREPETEPEPEPGEVLGNTLIRLEKNVLPNFHKVVATRIKVGSIPAEDPDEKKFKRPPTPEESPRDEDEDEDEVDESSQLDKHVRNMGTAFYESMSYSNASVSTLDDGKQPDDEDEEVDLTVNEPEPAKIAQPVVYKGVFKSGRDMMDDYY